MIEYILKTELKQNNFQPLVIISEITIVCGPAIMVIKRHFDMKICEIFKYVLNLCQYKALKCQNLW